MPDALLGESAQGVVRAIQFAGIMGIVGGVLFAWRITPAFAAGEARDGARDGALRALRLSAALLSLTIAARLVQQAAAFADVPAAWRSAVALVLTQTTWGTGWILQAIALPCVVLLAPRLMAGRSRPPLALGIAPALVVALASLGATPALSGHAVGAPRLATAAVVLDTLHLLAAGAWLGTLAVIAAVALPRARREGGLAASAVMGHVLARFSPVALVSAAVLASSGAFASWLHLGTLGALWTTAYGMMLVRKLVLLALVAAVGAYNWKVVTPRLVASGDVSALRRSVTVELALAAALIAVTAVLVATPLPAES